jgi:ankyrin repeat protein
MNMSLLSLPLELFRNIIDLAVVAPESKHGLQIRLVNRECLLLSLLSRRHLILKGLFDEEILHCYARNELLKNHRCIYSRIVEGPSLRESYGMFLAKYLLQRPHIQKPSLKRNHSVILNEVVDRFIQRDKGHLSAPTRHEYMKRLCNKLNLSYTNSDFFPDGQDEIGTNFHEHDHDIIASIYLEQYDVFRSMMDDMTWGRIVDIKSEQFGTPLIAAIEMRNIVLSRELLQRGADANMSKPGKMPYPHRTDWPLIAAVRTGDIAFVQLLLEPCYGCATDDTAFCGATSLALYRRPLQADMVMVLLHHCTRPEQEFKRELASVLCTACQEGWLDVVRILIDYIGNYRPYTNEITAWTAGPVEMAAWKGHEEVLRFLISRGGNPYGDESGDLHDLMNVEPMDLPMSAVMSMRAVAWSGQVGTARILLEAGVRLHHPHWSNILEIAMPRKESTELVKMWLESGAFDFKAIDPKDQADIISLTCKQGNVGVIHALQQHGISMKEISSYAQMHGIPPPLLVAKAFKHDFLVQALLDSGVSDIEPLETPFAEHFESGEFPRDPSPRRESRMPWHP